MAWSVTQGLAATPTQVAIAANGTTTKTITPTAVGSTLFATIAVSGAAGGSANVPNIASVSDSVDGAWTLVQVTTSATTGTNTGGSVVIAYRDNASSTASRTVTLTCGTKAGSLTWSLGEATHSGITFSVDGSATAGSGATASGTTVTVSGPTPSVAGGLAIGVGLNDGGSGWTAPTGGIWSVLWSLTASGVGTDGRAVAGVGPTAGSAMSTAFTETGASSQVPAAAVVVFAGASGTSANLTAQTGTFTEGTVGRNVDYTLGSQTATFTEGTISASTGGNVTLSLSGQTATFTEGTPSLTLGYSLNDGVPLTGQTATLTEGTPTETLSYALTGQTGTFTEGAPSQNISYTLGSQTATFTEGSLTATQGGNITKTLTGQTATFTEGSLSSVMTYSVTGLSLTSTEGSLSDQCSYAITGRTATFTEGTITAGTSGNVSKSLTGLSASFTLGLITAGGGTTAKNVMPNLFGLNLWAAIQSLEDVGIVNTNTLGYFGTWPVSVTWIPPTKGVPYISATATPGIVIGQSIVAGVSVPPNSPILLNVVQYTVGVSYPG